ncbi:MAG TPA: iron ABC transporter permease [Gemmatimonadaceae bacterium]|nr:iron ABC transporter permease [Gemmatimonadaceae bacterium]
MKASHTAFLVVALALAASAALLVGPVPLAVPDVMAAIVGAGDTETVAIVRTIRLPRVVLGALVGAGLSMSGVALQATMRNPLAEPYLLGVSGGAAVGAVAATASGVLHPFAVELAAFAGAGAAVALVILVARASHAPASSPALVMAGVVVGAFANAAILVVLAGAPAGAVRDALWWMMGSLNGATWTMNAWLAAIVAGGAVALWTLAREIDVLSLGGDAAAALGVEVDRATRRAFVVAALVAAATVAAAGLVGFVGLVVPALVRALGARGTRPTLRAAAVAGAALVVAADIAARTARAPAELPLGAVTALIGVPFFLARLRHTA